MKSRFRDRSEFEESLNIYPGEIFSLKLEGFLGLLGALGIFWSWKDGQKVIMVSRGTIRGWEDYHAWGC